MNTKANTWVMIKIDVADRASPYYKVFASLSGGYPDGDSWRLNSGVVAVSEDDHFYYFHGFSGSVYQCHKNAYGIRNVYVAGVLAHILERADGRAEVLDENTDFINLDYGQH